MLKPLFIFLYFFSIFSKSLLILFKILLIIFSLWLLISHSISVLPGTILIADPPLIFPIFNVVSLNILPILILFIISADTFI